MRKLLSISLLFFIANSTFAQTDNTLEQLNKELSLARDAKDFNKLADLYLQIGDFEEINFKNHEKAFDYYTRSIEYYKLLGDSTNYYTVRHRIANQYRLTGQYREAIMQYNFIIAFYNRNEEKDKVKRVYLDLAKTYGDEESIEEHGEYLDQVSELLGSTVDSLFYLDFLFEKIKYFESLKDYKKINDYGSEAYQISDRLQNQFFISKSLYALGSMSANQKKSEDAIRYLNNSLLYLGKKPLEPIRLNIYKLLGECYQNVGDYNKAYDFVKSYSKLNDSILNRDRLEAINNVTFKYESRAKANEIKLLEKENDLAQEQNTTQKRALYVLGLGLAFLSVIIYFVVQYFRQRIQVARIINLQRDELNKTKIRDLENDVKISSLQSVLEGQELERERIAKDLHDSLGGLLSAVKLQFEKAKTQEVSMKQNLEYTNAQTLLDTAVDEVRNISRNLQPGSLKQLGLVAAINDLINRYVGEAYPDIHFQHYALPVELNGMVATSIYRVIQELLNNAIKYAKAKEILIQLNTEEDEIVISFEDDGIGFDPENLTKKGMGLENIRSRVNYLKGNLEIDSSKDEGTSFLISVKYKDV